MNLDFWKAQTHDLYQLYSIFIFLTSTITILHFLYHFKWILAGNTFVKWYVTQKIIYNWSKTVLSRQRGGEGLLECASSVLARAAWERWCGGGNVWFTCSECRVESSPSPPAEAWTSPSRSPSRLHNRNKLMLKPNRKQLKHKLRKIIRKKS